MPFSEKARQSWFSPFPHPCSGVRFQNSIYCRSYLFIFQDQLHTEEVEQLPDLKAIFLPWGMSPKAAMECHTGLLIYQLTAWAAFIFTQNKTDSTMHNSVHNVMSAVVQAFEIPAVSSKKSNRGTCYGNHWAAVLGEKCTTANTVFSYLAILGLNCSSFLLLHQQAHWSHCLKPEKAGRESGIYS